MKKLSDPVFLRLKYFIEKCECDLRHNPECIVLDSEQAWFNDASSIRFVFEGIFWKRFRVYMGQNEVSLSWAERRALYLSWKKRSDLEKKKREQEIEIAALEYRQQQARIAREDVLNYKFKARQKLNF